MKKPPDEPTFTLTRNSPTRKPLTPQPTPPQPLRKHPLDRLSALRPGKILTLPRRATQRTAVRELRRILISLVGKRLSQAASSEVQVNLVVAGNRLLPGGAYPRAARRSPPCPSHGQNIWECIEAVG